MSILDEKIGKWKKKKKKTKQTGGKNGVIDPKLKENGNKSEK